MTSRSNKQKFMGEVSKPFAICIRFKKKSDHMIRYFISIVHQAFEIVPSSPRASRPSVALNFKTSSAYWI
jgi:hypothetical protein